MNQDCPWDEAVQQHLKDSFSLVQFVKKYRPLIYGEWDKPATPWRTRKGRWIGIFRRLVQEEDRPVLEKVLATESKELNIIFEQEEILANIQQQSLTRGLEVVSTRFEDGTIQETLAIGTTSYRTQNARYHPYNRIIRHEINHYDEDHATLESLPTRLPMEEIPGLVDILSGRDTQLATDLQVAGVNCSRLVRLVIRDIYMDQQKVENDRCFEESDPVSIVSLKRGLLVDRCMPSCYQPYVSIAEWSNIYRYFASDCEMWTPLVTPPRATLVQAVNSLEVAMLEDEITEDYEQEVDLGDLTSDERDALRSLYRHLHVKLPQRQSEASYTAKYCLPHFNRLVRNKRWDIAIDSTMADRKRPDITISAHGRIILVAELKGPFASSTKRKLELGDGLQRALRQLKADTLQFDWGEIQPRMYTAISPDGLCFHIYKVQIVDELCFFVQLGKVPIANSFENSANVGRCLMGFGALRNILNEHAKIIKDQPRRHVFQSLPSLPNTPDKSKVLADLRRVYPQAASPLSKSRRRDSTIEKQEQ
ncbi:uncharacterized protein SPPG_06500 [Spizellomyces punctatus DAOM BR117]|uniref:Uncharacterized protein n=1 Tax=Spizellomyces punctatus (strain DAOM BR117) TaxID=645134 RepID=A0A0L0H994_SPIPD|nr:uncharacterized protein SPPG_06500 [Spizellomyces punctatus DAOM BR117]KNC98090.1 hypothetical protein SPPG_06500 [Spizellomyces punctatus DAOM BR117]|eukprot:XP_016606130.1 hypothetical protein SPPG_06500 [Spizellomyces punctatus DAOM BR117]